MTEDEKMQVAVFRFGVISDFVNGSWHESNREKPTDAGEVRPKMADSVFRKDPDQQGNDSAMDSCLHKWQWRPEITVSQRPDRPG